MAIAFTHVSWRMVCVCVCVGKRQMERGEGRGEGVQESMNEPVAAVGV